MEAARITEKTYRQYKDEPEAVVKPKRRVLRMLIARDQDVDYNEARMAGLDRGVHAGSP